MTKIYLFYKENFEAYVMTRMDSCNGTLLIGTQDFDIDDGE